MSYESIDREYGITRDAKSGEILRLRMCTLRRGSRLHLTHVTSQGTYDTACGKEAQYSSTGDATVFYAHVKDRLCPTCLAAVEMEREKVPTKEDLSEEVKRLRAELKAEAEALSAEVATWKDGYAKLEAYNTDLNQKNDALKDRYDRAIEIIEEWKQAHDALEIEIGRAQSRCALLEKQAKEREAAEEETCERYDTEIQRLKAEIERCNDWKPERVVQL